MKILSVELPKIIQYYISPNTQKNINKCFDTAEVNVYDNVLEVNIQNNSEVYEALKVIKDKIQTTTIGNGKKLYEYELDINIKDGHIFIFILEDNNNYICNLTDISLDKFNNIKLKFTV